MQVWAYIVSQFKRPHGALGHVAGIIMANRDSNKQRNAWTVELLDIQPDDNVLEFGCGPGLALLKCTQQIKNGRLVAIDHSPIMLQQAKSRLQTLGVNSDRVEFIEGGIERLQGFLTSFDKIYTINVIQFLDDKPKALKSLYDALSPNGVLAITYMPRNRNASTEDAVRMSTELMAVMTKVGFQTVRTSTLSLSPVPAICVTGCHP